MKRIFITVFAVFVLIVAFAYTPNIYHSKSRTDTYKYYKIIKAYTASALSADVTHEMDNGWQPTAV